MLDAILPNKGSDGIRLDETGKKLSIIFEIDNARAQFIDMMQLALPMFQAVGSTHRCARWIARCGRPVCAAAATSTPPATSSVQTVASRPCSIRATLCRPTQRHVGARLAALVQRADNKDAIEPPAPTQKQMTLYDDLQGTSDPAKQADIMKQILQIAADEFYVFGVSQAPDGYGVVKNDLGNFTKTMPNSFGWPTPAPTRPEQFYKA